MEHTSTPYFIKAVAKTDKGNLRTNNEDNFALFAVPCPEGEQKKPLALPLPLQGCVFVVADGLGGTRAGEVASEIAVESILHQFQELTFLPQGEREIASFLKNSIWHAHEEIVAHIEANKQLKGMGTTIVLAWLLNGKLHVAWSGDSRCYLVQDDAEMTLLTEDHSKVWEWVKRGLIAPEQARTHPQAHIITQALGDKKLPPAPSFKTIPLAHKNKILLCSDGLNAMLPDIVIARTFAEANQALEETAHLLVEKANQAGGIDNITLIAIEANSL